MKALLGHEFHFDPVRSETKELHDTVTTTLISCQLDENNTIFLYILQIDP